jgi:cysteine-rich CPXCG protein
VPFALNPEPGGWAGDERLDEEFPLGDGTCDTAADVFCPYCGEDVTITLDPGSGARQEYVEDCPICCQPWQVFVTYGEDGHAEVALETADGT